MTRDQFRAVLEVTELAPGTDLRRILIAAREARIGFGWACEEIGGSCGFFFADKDGTRVIVSIERHDPSKPSAWHH